MNEAGDATGTPAEERRHFRPVEMAHDDARQTDSRPLADGHTDESACLNCGTGLIGSHCHRCGQKAHIHRTMSAFLHDLLHGALHFEGKIFRTLPLLVRKPGELTRRYIAGERARFVSPMALFLFSVFLMFAVFQIADIRAPAELEPGVVVNGVEVDEPEQRLAALREARAEMGTGNPAAAVLDLQIEGLEKELGSGIDHAQATTSEGRATDTQTGFGSLGEQPVVGQTGWEFLDKGVEKWRQNPSLMAYKLQANSYKFSWLLIPLSIPFVWLLFAWRRPFGPYDHAVFVTYSLSFMTQLFVVLTILGLAGASDTILFFGATLIPLLHIYKQLRGAYALPRFSALWRTAALSMFILVILFLFVDFLLLLGVLG